MKKPHVCPRAVFLIKILLNLHPVPETGVNAALLQQAFVIAAFLDAVVADDENLVRVLDGRKAVRDHDGRPAVGKLLEAVLDHLLGGVVERARRFVEDEHRRVL